MKMLAGDLCELTCTPSTEEIACEPWRWGTRQTFIYHDPEGKHWKFTLTYHSQEGLDDEGDVDMQEVKPVEVTTTKWVPA